MTARRFRRLLEGLVLAGILPPRFRCTHGGAGGFYAGLIEPLPLEGEEWKAA